MREDLVVIHDDKSRNQMDCIRDRNQWARMNPRTSMVEDLLTTERNLKQAIYLKGSVNEEGMMRSISI